MSSFVCGFYLPAAEGLCRGLFRLMRTLKGVSDMTINLFFLTLTIKKRFKSLEEFEREQQIEQIYDEMKESQLKHLYLTNWR